MCVAFLLERELFTRGWDTRFKGEVSGLVGGGAFVRFGGELADAYEGFLPARLLHGDYYDLNETETALVGRRQRPCDQARRSRHGERERDRGAARAGRFGARG